MTKERLTEISRINHLLNCETNKLVKLKNKSKLSGHNIDENKIKRCEMQIKSLTFESAKAIFEINSFIDEIDDSLTRQILYCRYIKCMSWQKIASVTGGIIGVDGVRRIAERFLKGC